MTILDCDEMRDFAKEMAIAFNPDKNFISNVFIKRNILIDEQLVDISIDMLKNKDGTYCFYAAIHRASSDKKIFPNKEFLQTKSFPSVDDYMNAFIVFNQRISQMFYCKCRDTLCYLW
jgi:hypothetical protein